MLRCILAGLLSLRFPTHGTSTLLKNGKYLCGWPGFDSHAEFVITFEQTRKSSIFHVRMITRLVNVSSIVVLTNKRSLCINV